MSSPEKVSYLNQCGTSKNRCHQTDCRNAVRTCTEHPGAKLFHLSSPVTKQSPSSRVGPPSLTKPRTEKKASQLPNLHLLGPLRRPATHRLQTACRPLLLVPTHFVERMKNKQDKTKLTLTFAVSPLVIPVRSNFIFLSPARQHHPRGRRAFGNVPGQRSGHRHSPSSQPGLPSPELSHHAGGHGADLQETHHRQYIHHSPPFL